MTERARAQEKTMHAFECSVKGTDWAEVVNAETAGRAKAIYWRDVRDSWECIPYTDIRAKRLGSPRGTRRLAACCASRGVELRAGQRVRVGVSTGIVVDGASGANFLVAFTSGKYAGCRLAVHPSEIVQESSDV